MFLTESQITKIKAALSPLYADPEFADVEDLDVKAVEKIVPVPTPATDDVDVPAPTDAVVEAPVETPVV